MELRALSCTSSNQNCKNLKLNAEGGFKLVFNNSTWFGGQQILITPYYSILSNLSKEPCVLDVVSELFRGLCARNTVLLVCCTHCVTPFHDLLEQLLINVIILFLIEKVAFVEFFSV